MRGSQCLPLYLAIQAIQAASSQGWSDHLLSTGLPDRFGFLENQKERKSFQTKKRNSRIHLSLATRLQFPVEQALTLIPALGAGGRWTYVSSNWPGLTGLPLLKNKNTNHHHQSLNDGDKAAKLHHTAVKIFLWCCG